MNRTVLGSGTNSMLACTEKLVTIVLPSRFTPTVAANPSTLKPMPLSKVRIPGRPRGSNVHAGDGRDQVGGAFAFEA